MCFSTTGSVASTIGRDLSEIISGLLERMCGVALGAHCAKGAESCDWSYRPVFATVSNTAEFSSASKLCEASGTISRSPFLPSQE